jgi:hypothetical protein
MALDAGSSDLPEPGSRLTFEQWLDVIEKYRDAGCNSRDAEWVAGVKTRKLSTSWKASEGAFKKLRNDVDFWKQPNAPEWDGKPVNEDDARAIIKAESIPLITARITNELKNANKDISDKEIEDALKEKALEIDQEASAIAKATTITPDMLSQSKMHVKLITGLDFTANIMGHPFRAAFMEWAVREATKEGGYLKGKLAEYAAMDARGEELHYDLFRAEMLEKFGQDMLGENKDKVSRLFTDKLNNKYAIQSSDRKWHEVTDADLAEWLQKKDGPNIVISANHAYGEAMGDVEPITDNYKKVVKCSTYVGFSALLPDQAEIDRINAEKDTKYKFKDRANIAYDKMLELEKQQGKQLGVDVTPYDKRPFQKGQTILVAAIQTRENNFLNLAQLFQRLYDVDMANKANAPFTKAALEENVRRRLAEEETLPMPKPVDDFRNNAPIARSIVKTLLMSIAEKPSHIQMNDAVHPPHYDKPNANLPIMLRADATEILRKAIFFGFSKGGNDFRDGLRLLAHTLNEEREGVPVFETRSGTLKDIVNTVSVTAQSLNEKEMDRYYEELGVDTTYFANTNDNIAMPADGMGFRGGDRVVVYNGRTEDGGHHPGVIMENIGQHPYILQLHRCILASAANMPAVRFMEYAKFHHAPKDALAVDGTPVTDESITRYGLAFRLEPGTTDEMFESSIPKLQRAFATQGLGHLRIGRIPDAQGCCRYELYSTNNVQVIDEDSKAVLSDDHGEGDMLTREMMRKLADVFYAVGDDKTNGIIMSTAVSYPMLSTLGNNLVTARHGHLEKVIEGAGPDSVTKYVDKLGKDGRPIWKERVFDCLTGEKVHEFNMERSAELVIGGSASNVVALGREPSATAALAS